MRELALYFHTVRRMKPSQIIYRVAKKFGLRSTIGCGTQITPGHIQPVRVIPELDFDPVFLHRFSADELLLDRVTFLHTSHKMNWNGSWQITEQSDLWNFNLHYFEYLFPLYNAFQETGNRQYLEKAEEIIRGWIGQNPCSGKGHGWAAYTIDLRLTHWLSFYTYAEEFLSDEFRQLMCVSVSEQYTYLSRHVEKDILGNHYFEDLKALLLCAIFFDDSKMLVCALKAFKKECSEEILADGMHYERSPMYHKLILEGLMKAAAALRGCGQPDDVLEEYISLMLDAAWSMEESLERVPLFNDSGNNVAKSLDSLASAAKSHFDLTPVYRSAFPEAGFYLFRHGGWKLIADAGEPGPSYIPGHVHCDALSFELFYRGQPVLVNCGTYAYQSEHRSFFRSTLAHNTVCVNQTEQSQCWSVFRVAKRSTIQSVHADERHLTAVMKDHAGQKVTRRITFGDELVITDETEGKILTAALHFLYPLSAEFTAGTVRKEKQLYAPEYGEYTEILADIYEGTGKISVTVRLDRAMGEEI